MFDTTTTPYLLAVGDPLVALVPAQPVGLEHTDQVALFVGGAEINTAVGVRRLGVPAGWLGRVGDDPLGRRVVGALAQDGVDRSLVVVDPVAPTGVYLREWLPDGLRRPYYYRQEGAGAQLSATDWPDPWPTGLPVPTVLHVTGITAALSESAEKAVRDMVVRAAAMGCVVSVDPNYRPTLWPDRERARAVLGELARCADVLLISEEDGAVLFDSTDPAVVLNLAADWGLEHVVFKRGRAGAVVRRDGVVIEVAAAPVRRVVDPVGAGDGFDAGYLAASMIGVDCETAARCGAWCGARAVEQVGEHNGYPRRADLPRELRAAFDDASSRANDASAR